MVHAEEQAAARPRLHLFGDGVEYWCAETLDEAYAMRESETGITRADGRLDQVDDDKLFRAWISEANEIVDPEEQSDAAEVARTAARWAALVGKGFVFTTER